MFRAGQIRHCGLRQRLDDGEVGAAYRVPTDAVRSQERRQGEEGEGGLRGFRQIATAAEQLLKQWSSIQPSSVSQFLWWAINTLLEFVKPDCYRAELFV